MKRIAAAAALASCLASGTALAQEAGCGGDFAQWKAQIRAEAEAAGVGAAGLAALDSARVDQRVLDADRAQRVFTQTFTEFSSRMINDYRLTNGAANMKKHAAVFAEAERRYGVPPEVITAFWALETDFGAVQGDFDTLNALVTLAHDCRRPQLFRPQVTALLTLIDLEILPANVKGAWAGEIGQMQILPTDYLERGQDGDGDGKIDLRNSAPDAILTTANKIQHRGWRAGEPWMIEVRVPDDLPWAQMGISNRFPMSQWAEWGVTGRDGVALPASGEAGLALPMGHKGPAFLVFPNYDVYLEWNQSFIYTLTAAHLAARLAGAPPYDRRNPEPGLGFEAMQLLQRKLEARGHDVGGVDGILGAATRAAVKVEQEKLGLVPDGWPTPALLPNL
ncbi:MAG: lytic murein transglycosylase [Rhizobiaceae bacterium]|nr:lytic murein transglycosylase [Rhizobiaceae bacterium]MCV0408538.1 lytic murein transglycosylase [Rhizobiaceae bacterium]